MYGFQAIEDIRDTLNELKKKSYGTSKVEAYKRAHNAWFLDSIEVALDSVSVRPALIQVLTENWKRVRGTFCCYTTPSNREITIFACKIAFFCDSKNVLASLMPGVYRYSFHSEKIKKVTDHWRAKNITKYKSLFCSYTLTKIKDGYVLINKKKLAKRFCKHGAALITNLDLTAKNFTDVLWAQPSKTAQILCDAVKGKLGLCFKKPSDFAYLFSLLSDEGTQMVYNALQELWPSMIKLDVTTTVMLSFFNKEDHFSLLKKISLIFSYETDEPNILFRGWESAFIGAWIEQDRTVRTVFLKALREDLASPELAQAFLAELAGYRTEKFYATLNAFKEIFPNAIHNLAFLLYILTGRNQEECEIIFRALGEKHTIVQSDGFPYILGWFAEPHCTVFLEVFKSKLQNAIKNREDLVMVLNARTEEQSKIILSALQGSFLKIIENTDDFFWVLRTLHEKKQDLFVGIFYDQIINLIKFPADLRLLNCLDKQQREGLYPQLREKLPIMLNAKEITKNVCYFDTDIFKLVCETFNDWVVKTIEIPDRFLKLLEILDASSDEDLNLFKIATPSKRNIFFNVIKNLSPNIKINTLEALEAMFYPLTEEESIILFNALDLEWSILIQKTNDLSRACKALQYLNAEQSEVFFSALKGRELMLIRSSYTLLKVLKKIPVTQGVLLCKHFSLALSNVIRFDDSDSCLYFVTSFPDATQAKLIFQPLQEEIVQWINQAETFRPLFACYNNCEMKAFLFEMFQKQLPNMLSMDRDSRLLLCELSAEQCAIICKADGLLQSIKNLEDLYTFFRLPSSKAEIFFDALINNAQQLNRIFSFGKELNINFIPESRREQWCHLKRVFCEQASQEKSVLNLFEHFTLGSIQQESNNTKIEGRSNRSLL